MALASTDSKNPIHPTAIIEPGAQLGEGVQVGPYSYVGPHVVLQDRVQLKSHVVVEGHTFIGPDTVIFPFASIGSMPQDKKYANEPSQLKIGARNMFREHVTINPGTASGNMETIIGDDGLFMVGVHVAHDCIIGNNVTLSNNATLAGHVVMGNYVTLGGLSAVHQFVRIGDYAMIGGMAGVAQDIIPFGLVSAEQDYLSGLNLIGLKRRGFSSQEIQNLRMTYKMLFLGEVDDPNKVFQDRLKEVEALYGHDQQVAFMLDFIRGDSQRNLSMPRSAILG